MLGDPVGGLIARSHRLGADRRNTNYASDWVAWHTNTSARPARRRRLGAICSRMGSRAAIQAAARAAWQGLA